MRPYANFLLMVGTSAVLMFCLTYANTYQPSHVWFSWTRVFMAMIMAGSMMLVMLFFMRHMYKDARANSMIIAAGIGLVGLGLWLVRSQTTVGDVAWMKAMIPHHSIAILTSERAGISDPRARKLADEIIATQEREIAEMEMLIRDLQGRQPATQPASQP